MVGNGLHAKDWVLNSNGNYRRRFGEAEQKGGGSGGMSKRTFTGRLSALLEPGG